LIVSVKEYTTSLYDIPIDRPFVWGEHKYQEIPEVEAIGLHVSPHILMPTDCVS